MCVNDLYSQVSNAFKNTKGETINVAFVYVESLLTAYQDNPPEPLPDNESVFLIDQ